MNFVKKYRDLIYLAVIVLLILFLFKGCFGGNASGSDDGIDTTSDITTEKFEPVQGGHISDNLIPDTVYYPKPYPVLVEKKTKEPYPVYDPAEVDTAAILKDYYAAKIYSDTVPTKYGDVVIKDSISQNSIKGRSVNYDFLIPTFTRQITIEKQAKKRNVVYVGAGVWGSPESWLYGTEVSLSLKTKQDKIYSVKGMVVNGGQTVYGLGVSVPIRLKKR